MIMDIPQELVERLQDVAQRRGTTADKLLSELISEHLPTTGIDASDQGSALLAAEGEGPPSEVQDEHKFKYPPGTLARFAEVAQQAGLASKETVDTSVRSREILNAEFADYIDRRIRR